MPFKNSSRLRGVREHPEKLLCAFCSGEVTFLTKSENDFVHKVCTSCGHVFVSPMPSFKQIDDFYNEQYGYIKPPTVDRDKRHSFVSRYFNGSFENISVLDIGCANGDFLAGLKFLGIENLSGIELNKDMALAAKSRGFFAVQGLFDSNSFKNQTFDFINLGDVIEHVPDPKIMLQDLINLLAPKGIAIIATNNIDNFFSHTTLRLNMAFDIPWSSIDPPAHLNLFTHKSFRKLMSDSSLEEISSWPYRIPLVYELGHTHLYRKFREKKSGLNLIRWVFGWSLYTILFSLNSIISLYTKKSTGMVYVVKQI